MWMVPATLRLASDLITRESRPVNPVSWYSRQTCAEAATERKSEATTAYLRTTVIAPPNKKPCRQKDDKVQIESAGSSDSENQICVARPETCP
jgi:hypothetical protein